MDYADGRATSGLFTIVLSAIFVAACGGDLDTDAGIVRPTTLKDDRSRLTDDPGAYEWWNFFAVDEAQGVSVSMIFNSADPFNADYRRALSLWREDPEQNDAPLPRDYALLQLQVTDGGATVFSALRNALGTAASFSTEIGRGEIGDSFFEGSMEDGVKTYTVHIDSPDSRNEMRMEADIVLAARSPGFAVSAGMYGALEGGDRHDWQFPLGKPSAFGHVRITHRDDGVLMDADLEGGGYTDHMWGEGLLGDVIESWHFATADLGDDGALVHVYLTPTDGAPGAGYVFLEPSEELARAHPIEGFAASNPHTGIFELDYFSDIELTVAEGHLSSRMDPDTLAVDWPFQVAGPSLLDVAIDGLELAEAPATSEYLWQPGIDNPGYYAMFDYVHDAEWGEDWY